jgi:hypothetical protein
MTSLYPLSSRKEPRCCWMFSLTGHPYGYRCPTYPCLHVESYNLDFLSDREDRWSKPYLHMLMWACCQHPELLQDCKEALTTTRFAKLESGYQRCLRLEAKQGAIKAEFEAHERRTIEERLLYFAYWEACTEAQLGEFRKDEAFINMNATSGQNRCGKKNSFERLYGRKMS